MHGQYTIALCDILGFSALVSSTDLRILVEQLLAWFRKALHHSVHKNEFPEDVPTLTDINTRAKVGIAWFSDTILLYTREDSDDCIRALLGTVGWLLFETMLAGHTRIRAGIAYGDAFIDPVNSLYLGTPIVEAYRMEQIQEWSGASLAPSAMQRIPAYAHTGQFADWWVMPYAVPLKKGAIRHTLTVNWTTGFHLHGTFLPWSRVSEKPTEEDWQTRPDICRKWQNTKAFHDRVCRHCNR